MADRDKTRLEHSSQKRPMEDAAERSAFAEGHPGDMECPDGQKAGTLEETGATSELQNELRAATRRNEEAARQIDLLEREKAEIEAAMESMLRSTGWRILSRVRKFKSHFLPPGTRRRRLYDWAMIRFARPQGQQISRPAKSPAHFPAHRGPANSSFALPPAEPLSCSIIIPVRNRSMFTKACLLAIEKSVPAELAHEVIVVDDGSTDDTGSLLSAWCESRANARALRMEQNSGFAHACNEGARAAGGRYLVLLNNDTLPTPGWLEKMLELAAGEPQAGIVGSKLLFPDGRIQHVGVAFDEGKNPGHIYRGFPPDIEPARRSGEYQAVTGACLLVDRNLFWSVGGLDEAYENSYEDIDLCLKLRARGWRVLFCADSTLYHFESISENRHRHDFRNRALLKARWADDILCDMKERYAQDGVGEASTQFEGNATCHSEQENRLKDLWRKIYRGPYPEGELIAVSSGLRNG